MLSFFKVFGRNNLGKVCKITAFICKTFTENFSFCFYALFELGYFTLILYFCLAATAASHLAVFLMIIFFTVYDDLNDDTVIVHGEREVTKFRFSVLLLMEKVPETT